MLKMRPAPRAPEERVRNLARRDLFEVELGFWEGDEEEGSEQLGERESADSRRKH